MTLVDADPLRTIVRDAPEGVVIELHGSLSSANAPGVDSLLAYIRDSGEEVTIDLGAVDVDPEVIDLVTRRWGLHLI